MSAGLAKASSQLFTRSGLSITFREYSSAVTPTAWAATASTFAALIVLSAWFRTRRRNKQRDARSGGVAGENDEEGLADSAASWSANRAIPSRKTLERCWEEQIREEFERWRRTGEINFPPKRLHRDLMNLIVVNDASVLKNSPPKRFEDLTPVAKQILSGITPTISTVSGAYLPSKISLLKSFQAVRPYSTLTEGGRALTKHCHRCSSKWWGDVKGSADHINALAFKKVEQILGEATWRNVFYLPGNRPVCEFRVEAGYGVRWLWSPNEEEIVFRGFLEPPQENGHEVGWKH